VLLLPDTSLIYKATVTTKDTEKLYYGLVEGDFKKRWANHRTSFKNAKYEHDTALSAYVWSLKDKNEEFEIKWKIEKKSTPYTIGSKTCNLCTDEKLCILEANKKSLLNEKSKLLSKCRHRAKFLLKNNYPLNFYVLLLLFI